MLVFSIQVWELLFLYPSLWFTSPLHKVEVQYVQTVYGWEGVGCVGDHILQEFNTLFLIRIGT
jgi:hypothetical protein